MDPRGSSTVDPGSRDPQRRGAGAEDDPLADFPAEADVRAPARRPRPRGRFPARAARVGLIALAAALAVVALTRERKAPADGSAAAPPPAVVRVESTPPGASVWFGGREMGTTPLSIPLPPGAHVLLLRQGETSREVAVTAASGVRVVHHVELAEAARLGALQVETVPPGASVTLDGEPAGRTPLQLDGVEPGEHAVRLRIGTTSVTRSVVVAAGGLASIFVPLDLPDRPGAGWLSVSSPIELRLLEAGTVVGTSSVERVMLPAGEHRLRLVNEELGFETALTVTVPADAVASTRVTVPDGAISVNATPWAEVFIDGARVGETPIANRALALGPHDVVLRNPKFPEQRRRVVVTLKNPARLGVDMRQ